MIFASVIPEPAEQCSERARRARLEHIFVASAQEASVADLTRGAPTPRLQGGTMFRTTVRALACAVLAIAALILGGSASAHAASPTIKNLTTGADALLFPPDIAVADSLRGSDNDWAGSGVYTYQWYRCWDAEGQVCEPVDGATSRDYTTTALDWGLQVKFCAQVPRFDTACSANTRTVRAQHADSDGDGTPDYSDPCPNSAGPNNGCAPPVQPTTPENGTTTDTPATTGSQAGSTAGTGSSTGASNPAVSSVGMLPNGTGATTSARLTLVFNRSRAMTVGFGRKATIRGRLVDPSGRPISGALVDVMARRNVATTRFSSVSKVVTGADGRFTYVAPAGASRIIRLAYRAYTSDVAYADSTDVRLLVKGAVTLKVGRTVKNGKVTVFRGRLLGKPVPAAGVLVDLQVRLRNKWRTFATPRSRANGVYRYKYRFTQGPAKWVFRARIRKDSLYAYEMSYSTKAATRVIR